MVVVVMGVAGAGKSTLGRMLADALDAAFVEGDDYHPSTNVEKMSAGVALDDDDRWPWLDALAQAMAEHAARDAHAVVACSALKRRYRDRLRAQVPSARFVLLQADREPLAERLAARSVHFMPATLLSSQLEALEMPAPDESIHVLDATQPVTAVLDAALTALGVSTR